jgi:hypothetical protein
VEDEYGNRWAWEGDLSAVEGRVDEAKCLTCGDYPNAFERISSAMQEAKSGHLWVTALPGYEFCLPHVSIHVGGGSHGALHKGDSLSPLIVAGGPDQLGLPKTPRSIDIAPLCLRLLGLDPD